MRPKPLYEIGDTVSLTEFYRNDQHLQGKPYTGIIIGRDPSESALLIGASYNVHLIDGVGAFGEAALIKTKQ